MRIDYPRRNRTGVRHWLPSWRQLLALAGATVVAVVGGFLLAVALTTIPEPNEVATAQTTIVYWSDGTTELGRLGDANRISVPLDQVSVTAQHAVLAAEDRDFYDHGGFSPAGIVRAAWNNLTGGSTQGGSTITQQYAKNAFLTQDRTFSRKARELLLSVKLETSSSKDDILSDYLNTIYLGRGAYGIETAAQAYFGTSAASLDLAQSAALAAIIRSPGGYSPENNLAKLQGRWAYVLDGMVSKGWISQAQRDATVFPRFTKRQSADRFSGTDGYLLAAVRDQLLGQGFTEDDIDGGGLRIVTTFDRKAQRAAVAAIKAQGPTTGTDRLRIGLAAVTPGTGAVVAMYGGPDYLTDPLNNATQAIAQAGSTFKPFALAAATETGVPLSSTWNGASPRTIAGYTLRNYGNTSYGTVSLLRATEDSINTAYVDLTNQVGVGKVMAAATRAGIPADTAGMADNLTFVLGTASPHTIDLASAYATFAAHGRAVATTVLREVREANGGLLVQADPRPVQAFSADVADTVTYALSKVVTDGTGFAAAQLDRPAAGKTGTTDGNKSAWFVGYTPQLAGAVMMVKDDKAGNPQTLSGTGGLSSVTGGSFPARIWTAFMSAALQGSDVEEFTTPPDLVRPSPSATAPSPSVSTSPTSTPSVSVTPTPTPSVSSTPPSPTATPTSTPASTPPPSPSGSPTAPRPSASGSAP
ncbi:MAG: penicillin-binding protein [Actinomycetota bacterium]|nr:MAG: penicillin-binding protein [Actinomycetota bacterium]